MGHAATFRDCTQIEVPATELDGLESTLKSRFMVTLKYEADRCRIIAAPSELKRVASYLLERGVRVP